MSQLHFNPVGSYLLVLVAAGILLGLSWLGPPRGRLSTPRRAVLAGLRILVVLLVVFVLLRPARVVTELSRQSATLVWLIDQSRSMLVTDTLGGKSRWAALDDVLREGAPLTGQIAEDLELRAYAFDQSVSPLSLESAGLVLPQRPEGEQSAIGASLADVVRREAGKRIVGVLLLSDGAQRAYAPLDLAPQTAARQLADLGIPLYTFAFGQSRGLTQSRDVAVTELITNSPVFVKNQLDVSGMVRVQGFAGREIPVQLLLENAAGEMEVVAATRLTPSRDGALQSVALSCVPRAAGEFKLTLKAVAQDGELVTTNNALSTFVTVLQGGLKVLYLEGALRVEPRFLRAAIDASPDVQLDLEYIDPRSRDRWPRDRTELFQAGSYDVYILGDLDSAALTKANWEALVQRVDEGAGLIMLGGYHSFGPGGYQTTALRDVLPVTMHRLERQGFDEPISGDLHRQGPLKMRPTRLGLGHALLSLEKGTENARLWDALPPLDGANRFRGLKPGAAVLLTSAPPQSDPLLVAGTWGGGRVLAFAGDTTWRWVLEGFDDPHRRYWRQVILWLAKKDEATEGSVWVKLPRRRFLPGAAINFSAGASAPTGEPMLGATLHAQIITPDEKKESIRLIHDGRSRTGRFFNTMVAGDYTIVVVAENDGEPLGEAQARFLVDDQDLELDNPAANPGLLASMASLTAQYGGQALAAEELPQLLTRLRDNPPDLEIETEIRTTYWDRWWILLAFVALIGTEWALRKRWGLV